MKLKWIEFSDEIISPCELHTFWVKEGNNSFYVVLSEIKNRNMHGSPSNSIMSECYETESAAIKRLNQILNLLNTNS
jgi:Zn/Cd-binding protein ZinT